jgi:ribosomal protein S18 acetylase RimI-like enzyme
MNEPELRVWVADPDELQSAAELLGEFRDWIGAPTPADDRMLAAIERIHQGGDGDFLLGGLVPATPEGTPLPPPPAGVCQLRFRWSLWTDSDDAWIEDVFVREGARGAGLGRALVELALERARERGCHRIELDVDEGNTAALALYHRLGFAGDLKADVRSLLLGRDL